MENEAGSEMTKEETIATTISNNMPAESEQEIYQKTTAKEATEEFFGYLVEIDCGDEGIYKGIVTEIEPADNDSVKYGKIKLEKPFKNGVSLGTEQAVLIPGELIVDVKILMIPETDLKVKSILRSTTATIQTKLPDPVKPVKKVVHRVTPIIRNNIQPFKKNTTKQKNIIPRPTAMQKIKNDSNQKPSNVINKRTTAQQILNYSNYQSSNSYPYKIGQVPIQVLQRTKKILSITPPPPNDEHHETCKTNDSKKQEQFKIKENSHNSIHETPKKSSMPITSSTSTKSSVIVKGGLLRGKQVTLERQTKSTTTSKKILSITPPPKSELQISASTKDVQKKQEIEDEYSKQLDKTADDMAKLQINTPQHEEIILNTSEKSEDNDTCTHHQENFAESQQPQTTASTNYADSNDTISTDYYVGSLATIDCGNSCIYQGVISAVDKEKRTIRLSRPLLDAQPLQEQFIELSSEKMKDIKIIRRGSVCTITSSISCGNRQGKQQSQRHVNTQESRGNEPGGIYMQSLPKPLMPTTAAKLEANISPSIKRSHKSSQYNDNDRSSSSSPEIPPTPPAQLAYQTYGDYKKFTEPQTPTPIQLRSLARTNNNRISNNNNGPTGIPAIDCMNGYSGNMTLEDSMGDPLDSETLNTDFDFAGNLALFNKVEFAKQTEQIFYQLDTAGDNSRNFRNDENVLMDSTRVFSWTNSINVSDISGPSNDTDQHKKSGTSKDVHRKFMTRRQY